MSPPLHPSPCPPLPPVLSALQAQRKADALRQSLAALGDTVKAQTAPNKDVQKEIADMTEVWPCGTTHELYCSSSIYAYLEMHIL